jgi:hypothetical protein
VDLEKQLERAKIIHCGKYNYSLVDVKDMKEKAEIFCPFHGKFLQSLEKHIYSKQGCPHCRRRKNYNNNRDLVKNFFIRNNITFFSNYTFDDCKYQRKLKFDFYLPDLNLVVEFHNQQHYYQERYHEVLSIRNKIKKEYCVNNNIPLLEIEFDDNLERKLATLLSLGQLK